MEKEHKCTINSLLDILLKIKGTLVSMTRALTIKLALEIRVNSVIPAATDTNMLRNGFQDDKEKLNVLGSFNPLGRIAIPEEVAHVDSFLANQNASFMAEATKNVDGGFRSLLSVPETIGYGNRKKISL